MYLQLIISKLIRHAAYSLGIIVFPTGLSIFTILAYYKPNSLHIQSIHIHLQSKGKVHPITGHEGPEGE
jgi:hypothetical protein